MRLPRPIPEPGGWPPWSRLTSDTRRILALAALVLLALALRLVRLGYQPLWWDEGWSIYFAARPLGAMLSLTAVDIHPPLYYALLHVWIGLFGGSPLAMRLLSVLIGTATVPLLAVAGRRFTGTRGGLLAAFLLAISPFAVYYSQEVRMYGLVTLLGLAAFVSAPKMEGSGWSAASWIGYVLASTAALYTQYYAAFLLLALNLALMARWLARRRPLVEWLPWLSAQAAVLLLFLPWILFAGNKLLSYVQYKVGVEQDAPVPFLLYVGRHLSAFNWGHAEGGLAGWWWAGLLPLVLLGGCLLVSLSPRARAPETAAFPQVPREGVIGSALLACGAAVVGLVLGGFLVNLRFPFTAPRIERQLLLALPYFLLLISAGVLHLWGRRPLLGHLPLVSFLVVALVSLGFFFAVARYPEGDYRPLAARVAALGRADDVLVAVHPWQVGYFESYLPDDRRPDLVLTPREVLPRERQLWADDPERMASDLDALLAAHSRLWFPAHQPMGRVLEEQVDGYLIEHAYPAMTQWYGDTTVLTLFGAGQPQPRPVEARLGDWLGLEAAGLGGEPAEAGWAVVPVDLAWKLLDRPGEEHTVGLRLTDASGRVWAQSDFGPRGGRDSFTLWKVGESRPDRIGILVPAGTPPGDYQLTLRVYRTADLVVLPTAVAGRTASELVLGSVRIERPASPPPVEALAVGHSLVRTAGPLRLLGYSLRSAAPLNPGEPVEVDLFWQAIRAPGEDYLPRLQLLDGLGRVLAELAEKPVAGGYPAAWWAAGELVCDPHALPIPAVADAGRYRLVLSLVRAADGRTVPVDSGRTSVDLAPVQVSGRERNYQPPSPQFAQHAVLGTSVELLGYDLAEPAAAPGASVRLTLYWHALMTPDRNYRSFAHLLDADGQIVAQDDGAPGDGRLPTLGWLPGEQVADARTLLLPSGLAGGDYPVEVGLYDPATGVRLGEPVRLQTPIRLPASAQP